MTTAAAIAREDQLRYRSGRCSGDGLSSGGGDRYSTVIWLLGGNCWCARRIRLSVPSLPWLDEDMVREAVGAVRNGLRPGWAVGRLLCGWLVDRVGARTLVSTMLVAAACWC